ncbi:NAD(P)H-dependent oxidoreductase [Chryseobacterium oranimense]|uniref:NAD(P)H-dependent oxidoreductase n=1 Tax=Chryseobacterium oranimense TaxID=421058 RepID=UPI0021AF471F|nr:NAD(P)H-dependent oxidoreductase [Chryseobacterium oranimense]UWX62450.1 NAD(P)H-dependent oxidoreductase [Chryseobacterium oranimense]
MNLTKKVLLINTHLTYPNWSEGLLNDAFNQKAKEFFLEKGFEVVETKVENGYNADEEVEKHLEADIIILQTPVNWFGAPWIYKKYVDEVFNSGLMSQKFLTDDGRTREDPSRQYGTGGKLHGKKFMVCATWNAPKNSFDDPNQILFEGRSTADVFIQITSNYKFCGVEILPDYNCYDIFKEGDIVKDLEDYPKHLATVLEL